MKASEALLISQKKEQDDQYTKTKNYIYSLIVGSARLGNTHTSFEIGRLPSQIAGRLLKELQADGYIIRQQKTFNEKNGESYSYCILSWGRA